MLAFFLSRDVLLRGIFINHFYEYLMYIYFYTHTYPPTALSYCSLKLSILKIIFNKYKSIVLLRKWGTQFGTLLEMI